jgi:hypothetical protein
MFVCNSVTVAERYPTCTHTRLTYSKHVCVCGTRYDHLSLVASSNSGIFLRRLALLISYSTFLEQQDEEANRATSLSGLVLVVLDFRAFFQFFHEMQLADALKLLKNLPGLSPNEKACLINAVLEPGSEALLVLLEAFQDDAANAEILVQVLRMRMSKLIPNMEGVRASEKSAESAQDSKKQNNENSERVQDVQRENTTALRQSDSSEHKPHESVPWTRTYTKNSQVSLEQAPAHQPAPQPTPQPQQHVHERQLEQREWIPKGSLLCYSNKTTNVEDVLSLPCVLVNVSSTDPLHLFNSFTRKFR